MIGKLSVERCACVTWEVPDFFELSKTNNCITSPQFRFSDDPYCLRLFSPVCLISVGIELLRLPSQVSEKDVSYEIGCKSITGKELETEKIFLKGRPVFIVRKYFLQKERNTYVPEDTLRIFCRIRLNESSTARRLQFEVGETSFEHHTLISHQDEDHGGLPSVDKLQSDYKHLLLKETESDACLVVSGKEFQVHRNILRARSPIFDAMFSHDTPEKESGRVVIDDLDPDSFPVFLQYVYTGRVESFSDDNAFGVYVSADRYQLHTLKSECVEYMRKNLSVDSFCDVMTLALRHHETDLLEQAVEFFKKNLARIILTVKWQQFMSENSTRANELLIKALVPGQQ